MNNLTYGFERAGTDFRMFLDAPTTVFERVIEAGGEGAIDQCATAVDLEDIDGGVRLYVNPDAMSRIDLVTQGKEVNMHRVMAVGNVLRLLDSFDQMTAAAERDPLITISMSDATAFGHDAGLHAEISWPDPEISDQTIEAAVTEQMRATAHALRYKQSDSIDERVFAHIDRTSGVNLHVDSQKRHCMLTTLSATFHPQVPSFHLREHYLQNGVRKLIAVTGAVALAHVTDLLPPVA